MCATPAWAAPVPRRPKASAVASNAHKLLRLRPCMDSGSLAAHLACTDERATTRPTASPGAGSSPGAGAILAGGVTAAVAARRASASVDVPLVPLGTQPTVPARTPARVGRMAAPRRVRQSRWRRDSTGCCSSTSAGVRHPPTRVCWSPGCGRSSAASTGAPTGCCSPSATAPMYFTRVLGVASPLARATSLSSFESPAIDSYHVCMHLACDDEHAARGYRGGARHGPRRCAGVDGSLSLAPILIWRETRTGFTGGGLPAAHQHVHGHPGRRPGAERRAAVHGLQIGAEEESGD